MEKEKKWCLGKGLGSSLSSEGNSRLINLTKSVKYAQFNEQGQCIKLVGFCKAKDFKRGVQ